MATPDGEVYVVSTGEYGEGHSPVAVFSDIYRAAKLVSDRYGVWCRSQGSGRWMANIGVGRVDEVWIEQLPLDAYPAEAPLPAPNGDEPATAMAVEATPAPCMDPRHQLGALACIACEPPF